MSDSECKPDAKRERDSAKHQAIGAQPSRESTATIKKEAEYGVHG
jgi:hypothetical protein